MINIFFYNFFLNDILFIPIGSIIFIYIFIYLNFKHFFFKLYIKNKEKKKFILKNFYNLNSNYIYKKLVFFILNFFCILSFIYILLITYYYNYINNYIFLSFQVSNLSLNYFKLVLIFSIYSFIVLKKNYNKTKNFELLISYFFFFSCLLYYLSVNNILTLIFIFELQSMIFIYLLSNLFYIKDSFIINKFSENSLWYLNSILYQFWVSFLGIILLVYTLLVFLKKIYFLDWINIEIYVYFLNFSNFYLNNNEFLLIFLPLILGILLKLGIFPFFFWKPEIYRNFSLDIIFVYMTTYMFSTSYFIIFIITTYFLLINKFVFLYFNFVIVFTLIFLPIVFYSVTEIRLFLGYTYLFHIAIILISSFLNSLFYYSSFIYLIVYIYFSFYLIVLLYYISNINLWYFTDFQVFFKNNLVNLVLFNLMLGMSGIPPFLGFFSKISVVSVLMLNENYFYFFIFFISGLVLSFYYIQNYRFFGYNLKSINYSKDYLVLKLNFSYLNYLILFIFFNLFSFFFFSDLLVFSYTFKLN